MQPCKGSDCLHTFAHIPQVAFLTVKICFQDIRRPVLVVYKEFPFLRFQKVLYRKEALPPDMPEQCVLENNLIFRSRIFFQD